MNMLVRIVKRHHLFVWAGTWTIVMVMGWGAIALLLNPNLGQPSASAPQPPDHATPESTGLAESPPPPDFRSTQRSDDPTLAFWALGIVAIACGYGSMVLSQHLKSSSRR